MCTLWAAWLGKFDQLGMTIVVSAGNAGYNEATGAPAAYTTDFVPTSVVNAGSPVIVVGSTFHDGSLDHASTPGRGDSMITMYAQGKYVRSCLQNTKDDFTYMDGTSFAAPQVVSSPSSTSFSPSIPRLSTSEANK